MKKGKYLITGCAGFIGSNLVKNIYKTCELILVDDLSEGSITNLPKILNIWGPPPPPPSKFDKTH